MVHSKKTKIYYDTKTHGYDDVAWHLAKVWEAEGNAVKEIARRLSSYPSQVKYHLKRPVPSERKKNLPPRMSADRVAQLKIRRATVNRIVSEIVMTSRGPRKKFESCRDIAREINRCHPELPPSNKQK